MTVRDRSRTTSVLVALLAVAPVEGGAGANPLTGGRARCYEEQSPPEWTRIHKVPSAAAVNGVWVSEGWPMVIGDAASEVWTVAEDGTIAGLGSFAQMFALYKAPNALRGITGNRAREVWAVGDRGIILKWATPGHSAAWVRVPSGVTARLNAVFAPDATRRWAVGEQTTILRDDGPGWRRVVPPGIAGDLSLRAIWGADADELWVTSASPALLHLRGGTWTKEETGAPGALLAVAGSAADDVWAVGERGVIMHWDGRRWSAARGPEGRGATLRGVWAGSRRDAWAVGDAGTSLGWDGTRWTQVDSGSKADLFAVAGGAVERFGLGVAPDADHKLTSLWTGGAAGPLLAFSRTKAWICPP